MEPLGQKREIGILEFGDRQKIRQEAIVVCIPKGNILPTHL